jgi:hypothetical protein
MRSEEYIAACEQIIKRQAGDIERLKNVIREIRSVANLSVEQMACYQSMLDQPEEL